MSSWLESRLLAVTSLAVAQRWACWAEGMGEGVVEASRHRRLSPKGWPPLGCWLPYPGPPQWLQGAGQGSRSRWNLECSLMHPWGVRKLGRPFSFLT